MALPNARRAPAEPWRASMTVEMGPTWPPTPLARRAAAEPWRASVIVAGYHRLCYAPVARCRAGRPRRASLPRDHRDPQGLEGEVRARQADGPAVAGPRAALGRALPRELRLSAADLLRGRRRARRARARPGTGGAAVHSARARDRRHDHARREGPGRQDHRRARGRSGVRALHGHCRATAAPPEGAAALLPRLQGAGGQDGGGRALSRARRGRARDPRRDWDVHGSFRQSKRHPGAMSVAGDSVTADVTTGAILDEITGRNVRSASFSRVVREVMRVEGFVPYVRRRLTS